MTENINIGSSLKVSIPSASRMYFGKIFQVIDIFPANITPNMAKASEYYFGGKYDKSGYYLAFSYNRYILKTADGYLVVDEDIIKKGLVTIHSKGTPPVPPLNRFQILKLS